MTINPDEFEAGTNVTARVRGEKAGGLVVSVRLSPEDAELLVNMAQESTRTVADLARQAIRAFLKLKGQTISYPVEITYGTPPSNVASSPSADTHSDRETFGPPVLQHAGA